MKVSVPLILSGLGLSAAALLAEEAAVTLPAVTVYSERVANQEPVGTFAMPVSALRYEPLVDIQARNQSEGQADVTIRGGIFENTGFRIGGVSLYDPQTGHYFAELPVAPAMLAAPQVLTGADNALLGFNANVGTVAHAWRKISTRGEATLARGDHDLDRHSLYQGYVSPVKFAGQTLAADAEYSHSTGNGTVAFGDHRFSRVNARVQLSGDAGQTDFFFGYQAKFFGWPNLYTPNNVKETENLQTSLAALNHRLDLGSGNFAELGAFHRRNKDDYEFNRFIPGQFNPYRHTTRTRGVALSGRGGAGPLLLNYSAEVVSDSLDSTSLTVGTFKTRTYTKAALVPETDWTLGSSRRLVAKAGATFDDTNHDNAAYSPVVELALLQNRANGLTDRYHFSYAKTTQVATYTALKSSPSGGLFRGNAALGRERAHNAELGWAGARGGWTLRSAAFYRRDDDLVDWTYAYIAPNARRANAVDIGTAGFEGVATFTGKRMSLVFGYTWLDKTSDYGAATVDASFYALNYARHRLTAAAIVQLGAGFELRMDNAARVQEDNRLRATGGDKTLLSSLALLWRPKAVRGFEAGVGADNLWDSNYQEVPSVPASRRQITGSVTYRW